MFEYAMCIVLCVIFFFLSLTPLTIVTIILTHSNFNKSRGMTYVELIIFVVARVKGAGEIEDHLIVISERGFQLVVLLCVYVYEAILVGPTVLKKSHLMRSTSSKTLF